MVKQQCEAGKKEVGKGGVVRVAAIHEKVVEVVVDFARGVGFDAQGVIPSPLLGPAGNREFLAHLRVRS